MTSLFSTAGTEEEQTEFCFKVYDLNEDGFISREEMLTMMGNCLYRNEVEEGDEGIKDLIDMTIRKMDVDKDGRISYSDFAATVSKDYLMMEAFGTCLPSTPAGLLFCTSVLDRA